MPSILPSLACLLLLASATCAQTLSTLDFRQPAVAGQWRADHSTRPVQTTADGLLVTVDGGDPWIVGPSIDLPNDRLIDVTLRAKSSVAGGLQLFWGEPGFSQINSVEFDLPAGEWREVHAIAPRMGRGPLRIDPPGNTPGDTCVIQSLSFSEVKTLAPRNAWPKPTMLGHAPDDPVVRCGDLSLRQNGLAFGAFELVVDHQPMGAGYNHPLIGYVIDGQVRYFALDKAATILKRGDNSFELRGTVRDPDGAVWTIAQRYAACPVPAAPGEARGQGIWATMEVSVDRDRDVAYLPLQTIFPGFAQGTTNMPRRFRDKGLFAGVEYLDEPDESSSNADFAKWLAWRQVTDTARITQPLMAITHQEPGSPDSRWIALAWQNHDDVCAVYDTPDRLYGSGGEVMGLLFPGSDGQNRMQNSLLPKAPTRLAAHRPLTVRAVFYGGQTADPTTPGLVAAEQTWLAMHPLPPLPNVDRAAYLKSAAAGWENPAIRDSARYRHAAMEDSIYGPAAACGDVPYFLAWLAAHTANSARKAELTAESQAALAVCPKGDWSFAGISHVGVPLSPLLFDGVPELVAKKRAIAADALSRFAADGSHDYVAVPGRADFGRTHYEKTANGYIAPDVAAILESALLTGDAQIKADGLQLLHTLDRYDGSVPRGAQTWECPLHSPDILAAAYLVKAYTEGYELTGDLSLLRRAVYWAWTGVPFVHLATMSPGALNPYATTAVYCATNWEAPQWQDRPVQWCGIVYAAALRRLADYAPSPWARIAEGIARSGILQTYPDNEKLRGLLPDSYGLRSQLRSVPAINPGTVQSVAMELWDRPYDYRVDRDLGLTVVCAGSITRMKRSRGRLEVGVSTWYPGARVLVAGANRNWTVVADGQSVEPQRGDNWLAVPAAYRLILVDSSAR